MSRIRENLLQRKKKLKSVLSETSNIHSSIPYISERRDNQYHPYCDLSSIDNSIRAVELRTENFYNGTEKLHIVQTDKHQSYDEVTGIIDPPLSSRSPSIPLSQSFDLNSRLESEAPRECDKSSTLSCREPLQSEQLTSSKTSASQDANEYNLQPSDTDGSADLLSLKSGGATDKIEKPRLSQIPRPDASSTSTTLQIPSKLSTWDQYTPSPSTSYNLNQPCSNQIGSNTFQAAPSKSQLNHQRPRNINDSSSPTTPSMESYLLANSPHNPVCLYSGQQLNPRPLHPTNPLTPLLSASPYPTALFNETAVSSHLSSVSSFLCPLSLSEMSLPMQVAAILLDAVSETPLLNQESCENVEKISDSKSNTDSKLVFPIGATTITRRLRQLLNAQQLIRNKSGFLKSHDVSNAIRDLCKQVFKHDGTPCIILQDMGSFLSVLRVVEGPILRQWLDHEMTMQYIRDAQLTSVQHNINAAAAGQSPIHNASHLEGKLFGIPSSVPIPTHKPQFQLANAQFSGFGNNVLPPFNMISPFSSIGAPPPPPPPSSKITSATAPFSQSLKQNYQNNSYLKRSKSNLAVNSVPVKRLKTHENEAHDLQLSANRPIPPRLPPYRSQELQDRARNPSDAIGKYSSFLGGSMMSSDSTVIEDLLSMPSAREQQLAGTGEKIRQLLTEPTAKQTLTAKTFQSRDGTTLREFCEHGTRHECCKMRNSSVTCDKVHFRRILLPHTDLSFGDCSYLDTCRHKETCRFVHYEIDIAPTDVRSHALVASILEREYQRPHDIGAVMSSVEEVQPQWIRCDLRTFDFNVLRNMVKVVMADPPWDIHMDLPYGTMTDYEMKTLRVDLIQDEGLLFLWVTGRAMELGRECLNIWGYKRVEEIVWIKTNQLQRIIRTGRTGHWLNHSKEHCLVGIKGENLKINRNIDCNVVVAEVRETSRKPDEIYRIIERLAPNCMKVELFGRQHNIRNNWITLGNQLNGVQLHDPELRRRYEFTRPRTEKEI